MVKVSVLMAVHNGFPFIREAVASILSQTERDLEFIVVDDGSTDETYQWLKGLPDERIRLFRNRKQLGLSRSLNKGLRVARGKYVARMDYDDLSLKPRLALQSKFMDAHPETDVLGTWARTIGRRPTQIWRYPVRDKEIKAELLFSPVLVHASVMVRRNSFIKAGLKYNPRVQRSQDYELWVRASNHINFANLRKVLLLYRIHPKQVGSRYERGQQKTSVAARLEMLKRINLHPTPSELHLHNLTSRWIFPTSRAGLLDLQDWLMKILAANKGGAVFIKGALHRTLERRWWAACRSAIVSLGADAYRLYSTSPLSRFEDHSIVEKARFWLKSELAKVAR